MGCGATRVVLLTEIQNIITSIKQENLELETQRDNLKLQQEMRAEADSGARDSINNLNSSTRFLELQLKNVKTKGVAFLPPTHPDHELLSRLHRFVDCQQSLDEKMGVISSLRGELDEYNNRKLELEMFIAEFETKISEIQVIAPMDGQQSMMEQNYYKDQVARLTDTKQELLKVLQEAESDCRQLTDDIKATEGDVRNGDAPPSYEHLLTLSEYQIRDETQRVEGEIEELSAQFKMIKQKEVELENMSRYIESLQQQGNSKISGLRKQVEQARIRVLQLRQEKAKLQGDMARGKKENQNTGIENKLQAVNDILDRNKERTNGDAERKQRISIADDIEETIRKARSLASNIKRSTA